MTTIVTANVEAALDRRGARRCLDTALDRRPDLVGLQEWRAARAPLLRRSGPVRIAGSRWELAGAGDRITWVAPLLGDCVIGLRSDRFEIERHRTSSLGGVLLADRGSRRPPLLPPRWATVVEARDRQQECRTGIICFHLVPGAQARGAYRADRPRTSRRHRAESFELQCLVDDLRSRCDEVWALGDSNFHGFGLLGLVSAWEGRDGTDGTLGSYRRIDDVLGPRRADDVALVTTDSDHRMVVAEHRDQPRGTAT